MPSLLGSILDSGAPRGSKDYTTVVILHGFVWHGVGFKKLLPLAKQRNSRIVALNRRDYPGSTSYSDEETATLARLAATDSGSEETQQEALAFMRHRSLEVFDALVELVKTEHIPRSQGEGEAKKGGVILVGWSFGVLWMLAFLAHTETFPTGDVDLREYVRRVVLYDGAMGHAPPPNHYHPLSDTTLPAEVRLQRWHRWAAGYFSHGEPIAAGTLAFLPDPSAPCTLDVDNMSEAERLECVHEPAGELPHGSDTVTMRICVANGVFQALKKAAFYLPGDEAATDAAPATDAWRDVEVRVVWCDRSLWLTPWAARGVTEDLEEARRLGKKTRPISLVRITGANHFAHWDFPEKTLRAFMERDVEVL